MVRSVLFSALVLAFLAALPATGRADGHPVAGSTYALTYHPRQESPLENASSLELVYVFNFWATRAGTRLALLENVLRPDSNRVHRIALRKTDLGWTAEIPIPAVASVLSYYVTDGTHRDDNRECTYASYVYGAGGTAVRNAHYFMASFLALARAPLSARVAELEEEVRLYPDNFWAYSMLFTLMLEQGKGTERTLARIEQRLFDLRTTYRDSVDFNNLAARTYFYVLRDVRHALAYKQMVPISRMWPDVVLIYDRTADEEERRLGNMTAEERRHSFLERPAPDVRFVDASSRKHPLRNEKGHAVVLVFWSLHSQHSTDLLEKLRPLYEKWKGRGVAILPVNIDADTAGVRLFDEHNHLPFPHLFRNGNELIVLGIDSIPITYVLDASNIVRSIVVGDSGETVDAIDRTIATAVQ